VLAGGSIAAEGARSHRPIVAALVLLSITCDRRRNARAHDPACARDAFNIARGRHSCTCHSEVGRCTWGTGRRDRTHRTRVIDAHALAADRRDPTTDERRAPGIHIAR
jgi:hypothetical protein